MGYLNQDLNSHYLPNDLGLRYVSGSTFPRTFVPATEDDKSFCLVLLTLCVRRPGRSTEGETGGLSTEAQLRTSDTLGSWLSFAQTTH